MATAGDGTLVGHWLRTRQGRRPLAVHGGWGAEPQTAAEVALLGRHRTPAPLREARRLARQFRAGDELTGLTARQR